MEKRKRSKKNAQLEATATLKEEAKKNAAYFFYLSACFYEAEKRSYLHFTLVSGELTTCAF